MKTLLRNAVLVDGTGRQPYHADVLVSGSTVQGIREPGTFDGIGETRAINVEGRILAPGFIDTHAHADNSPLAGDDDTSKIMQGCTTEVNGNCGFSLAPISPVHEDSFYTLVERIFPSEQYSWRSFADYRRALDRSEYITNFATLIGHNTIRIAAMGDENRAPSKPEFAEMERQIDEALDAGVCGLSSGLVYPPGVFSEPTELVKLAARLPETAIYASHMRSESYHLMDSLRETTHVAETAGIRCHVSHLKFADRKSSSRMSDALAFLDEKREQGLAVTQDMYPYTAASTMLTAVLPPWMHDGGADKLLGRLRSTEMVSRAAEQIESPDADFENYARTAGWEGLIIASTGSHRFEGLSVAKLAAYLGLDPVQAIARVLVEEQLRVTIILHVMQEEDVTKGLKHRYTMIGTDGLPIGTGGRPHPRGYGSFARVLDHYVKQTKELDLVDAIRRMTSLPAATFGLCGRGAIAEGNFADLVVVDPGAVADNATFSEPTIPPFGISEVFVNGEHVVENGNWSGRRAGRFVQASH